MAAATFWNGVPVKNLFSGANVWDWDTDTIKTGLTSSSYTPNQDTHDFYDDITNELATAGGYTAGGATITTPTVTYDTATNEIRLDCDDPTWLGATFTTRYGFWYKSTGVAATSPLIGITDFGSDQVVSSGTFAVTLNASGAFKAVAA